MNLRSVWEVSFFSVNFTFNALMHHGQRTWAINSALGKSWLQSLVFVGISLHFVRKEHLHFVGNMIPYINGKSHITLFYMFFMSLFISMATSVLSHRCEGFRWESNIIKVYLLRKTTPKAWKTECGLGDKYGSSWETHIGQSEESLNKAKQWKAKSGKALKNLLTQASNIIDEKTKTIQKINYLPQVTWVPGNRGEDSNPSQLMASLRPHAFVWGLEK